MIQPEDRARYIMFDFLEWDKTLPDDLQYAKSEEFGEAELDDVLLHAELMEHDRELNWVIKRFEQLGIVPAVFTSHTLLNPEGYVRIGGIRVGNKIEHDTDSCLFIAFTEVTNGVSVSGEPRQDVKIENYFIDIERCLITEVEGKVILGTGVRLPPNTPSIIQNSERGNRVVGGTAYTPHLPDYENTMNYEDVTASRQSIGRLRERTLWFNGSTKDD
jgi:hypothetical protein